MALLSGLTNLSDCIYVGYHRVEEREVPSSQYLNSVQYHCTCCVGVRNVVHPMNRCRFVLSGGLYTAIHSYHNNTLTLFDQQ